jgi:hypothetical protein
MRVFVKSSWFALDKVFKHYPGSFGLEITLIVKGIGLPSRKWNPDWVVLSKRQNIELRWREHFNDGELASKTYRSLM